MFAVHIKHVLDLPWFDHEVDNEMTVVMIAGDPAQMGMT